MEKLKQKAKELLLRIKRSITPKNIILFVLATFFILALIAAVIWAFHKLLTFIILNFHLLMLCGTIIGCFSYWLYTKNKTKKEQTEKQKQEQYTIDEEREQKQLESTYLLLKQILYLVLNDTSHVTKLPRITSISALESPTHHVKSNGYHSFLFLVAKGDSTVNTSYLQDILSTRIEQGLNTNEFDGITQKVYFHNSGKSYPIICVDKILDLGSYLQVNLCLAGKNYAAFKERSMTVENVSKAGTYDIDF